LEALIGRIKGYIEQPRTGFNFHGAEVLGNVIIVLISRRGTVRRTDAASVRRMAAAGNALWADLDTLVAGTGMRVEMIAVGG